MTVTPATLTRPSPAVPTPHVPPGEYRGRLADFDYVEEEWFATGDSDDGPYVTTVLVRRPRERARFSGTVVTEPFHAMGATPVWMYTSLYLMRAGHGWAMITSQKTALDAHVRSFDGPHHDALHIGPDASPDEEPIDGLRPPVGDPAAMAEFMAVLRQRNRASNTILSQVGAAIGASAGPFEGWDVADVILAGHSQTGGVVTDFIRNAHDAQRRSDGAPVFDGYFPSGAPAEPFTACEVPLVQVLSEGDISDPHRPGRERRGYRRPDSDEPGDRYRLYELAGVPHMGTRDAPYSDPTWWKDVVTAGDVATDVVMNSLPHNELFSMGLDHLVRWVADGVTPPRADRIEIGSDGYVERDDHGNSRGGVRCVQMDVPRARYFANPTTPDGAPAFGVVGVEQRFDRATLHRLYEDHRDYVARFERRLDELVAQGWLLGDDAAELRAEAAQAEVR
jgi:hypothetical protein